jgi:hypothetical protein
MLTIVIPLWIFTIIVFGRSATLYTSWTRVDSVGGEDCCYTCRISKLQHDFGAGRGAKTRLSRMRCMGSLLREEIERMDVPPLFRAAGLIVPEPSFMLPIPFRAFEDGWEGE